MPIVNIKSFLCILGIFEGLTGGAGYLAPRQSWDQVPQAGAELDFVIMLINFPLGPAYYGIHYQSDKQSSRNLSSGIKYIIEEPLFV